MFLKPDILAQQHEKSVCCVGKMKFFCENHAICEGLERDSIGGRLISIWVKFSLIRICLVLNWIELGLNRIELELIRIVLD